MYLRIIGFRGFERTFFFLSSKKIQKKFKKYSGFTGAESLGKFSQEPQESEWCLVGI